MTLTFSEGLTTLFWSHFFDNEALHRPRCPGIHRLIGIAREMASVKILGTPGAIFMSAAAVLILAACGGEGAPTTLPATSTVPVEPATVAPTQSAVPTATVEPTATAEPVATPTPESTATQAPTPTVAPSATPEPTVTPRPTATATPEPTATPIPRPTLTPTPTPGPAEVVFTNVDQYGFFLRLDGEVDVNSAGLIEQGPSAQQGIISFALEGANGLLSWLPPGDNLPLDFVAETYNNLRNSQPNVDSLVTRPV